MWDTLVTPANSLVHGKMLFEESAEQSAKVSYNSKLDIFGFLTYKTSNLKTSAWTFLFLDILLINWWFEKIEAVVIFFFPPPHVVLRVLFPFLMLLSILSPSDLSILFSWIFSFLLPWVRCYGVVDGPQAAAAYHRWEEGLDQHPGASPQAPAPELPGPRLASQSTGCGSDWGLLHQWIIRGQH